MRVREVVEGMEGLGKLEGKGTKSPVEEQVRTPLRFQGLEVSLRD